MNDNNRYPNLTALCRRFSGKNLDERIDVIRFGTDPNHENPDDGLRRYSTAYAWEQYKRGNITREQAVKRAIARITRQAEKDLAIGLDTLNRVSNAPDMDSANINVEWKRNPYYGDNPHAAILFYSKRGFIQETTGTCSGCGYDKFSTAICNALNHSDSALKALYDAAERALAMDPHCADSKTACTGIRWADAIAYGAGYTVLPHFEGGCGMSSTENVLNKCGYVLRHTSSGKHFNALHIERKEDRE